jgi:CheY-like chemotaxis protein
MARIFIVEDNTDIARLYQSLFSLHETCLAETAHEAISLLNVGSPDPDLVILDFHLPDEPGLTVLDYIRQHATMDHTVVWGISADDMMKDEAKLKGMNRFFRKPLDIPLLMSAFQRLFEEDMVAA